MSTFLALLREVASTPTSAHDLLLSLDDNGLIAAAWPSCRDRLGYSPEFLVGTSIDDLSGEGAVWDRLRADWPDHQPLSFRTLPGAPVSLDVTMRDLRREGGGWLLVGQGEAALDAVRNRVELLMRAIDAANNSIVIAENKGDMPLIYANPGFSDLTQYDTDEILGRNCRFLQMRHDGERDADQPDARRIGEAVRAGRFVRGILRNYKKDGTPFWNELYISPVTDAEGAVTHFIGVQNDVTDRVDATARYQKLAAELDERVRARTRTLELHSAELQRVVGELQTARDVAEEADRVKSAFLANMSHEIRTPLTGILGFAEILARRAPDDLRDLVGRIERGGKRLLDTLNLVLTLSQLDAGKYTLVLEERPIALDVDEIASLLAPRADAKGLRYVIDVRPEAETVVATYDRAALGSILNNLIGNALKFTSEGEVRVELSLRIPPTYGARPDGVVIRVSDTGPGIGPDFLPRLFDAFTQESSGDARSHEGAGLGLSLVKRLAELMGGDVVVESQQGRGTSFSVTLPYEAPEPPPDADVVVEDRGPRVLIVEDNEDSRFLLETLLEDICPIDTAPNAEIALELLRSRHYRVVLTDINLGAGLSGTDLLPLIRGMAHHAATPVIALTAYALPGDRERFQRLGFTEYIPKPFDVALVLDRVRAYVGREA